MGNREIIFRGKTINSGEWVESMTIAKGTIKRKKDCMYMELSEGMWVGVIPETVGQFTNLIDKNEKKIFENDLRVDGKGNIFRIYGIDGGFVIKSYFWKHNCKDLVMGDELIMDHLTDPQTRQYIEQSTTHCGNIFDNPELVKP